MAVVPFNRTSRGRRVSVRHYIWVDRGLFRMTSRLASDLAHGGVALPAFANSSQRTVEVFVETAAGEITNIQMRPTRARFGASGKVDLAYAAEAMAVILEGSAPKKLDMNVLDITPTLKSKQRDADSRWHLPKSIKQSIIDDIKGKTKLPVLRGKDILRMF